MKVLLSSRQVAQKLYTPILHDAQIKKVEILKGIVRLFHDDGYVSLIVENIDLCGVCLVSNVRFDWMYSVCSKINECPVILEFGENKCELTIQF